jgi:ATP-dependent Lon protease
MHCYNAGWESSPVRSELFTEGFGFIVDYLAEILRHLRSQDYSQAYKEHFELNSEITTRDRDSVQKTFSGLMKVLFPRGGGTRQEVEELLMFAIENRKRVKDQILKIDETFSPIKFSFKHKDTGTEVVVLTLEEKLHPTLARKTEGTAGTEAPESHVGEAVAITSLTAPNRHAPESGHLVVPENSKGYSYRRLFSNYLRDARQIIVLDPYVRAFWQIRNFMELVQLVHDLTPEGEESKVRLVTKSDLDRCVAQDSGVVHRFKSHRRV